MRCYCYFFYQKPSTAFVGRNVGPVELSTRADAWIAFAIALAALLAACLLPVNSWRCYFRPFIVAVIVVLFSVVVAVVRMSSQPVAFPNPSAFAKAI